MKHKKVRDIIENFCELMLKNEEETQFIKVKIGMKDKTNIKFKKFREYKN